MKPFIDKEIEQYAFLHTGPEPEDLQLLARQTREQMEESQMLTGQVEGRLLKMLVQIHQPAFILELGTFTGYSALSMAEGLGKKGKIVTCEIDEKARRMAQAAFDSSPLGSRIEIRMGPALETIRSLKEEIDFSFIDADKESYPVYYEEILQRTRPGGLILLDNMFKSGKALNPSDGESRAVAALNKIIASDDRVDNVLLTIRDGVQLVRKK
jgi:caffeoyl-CoA O-methyltransferase